MDFLIHLAEVFTVIGLALALYEGVPLIFAKAKLAKSPKDAVRADADVRIEMPDGEVLHTRMRPEEARRLAELHRPAFASNGNSR